MSNLVAIEGTRGEDMKQVFERAMENMDDCDGVVILMQKKEGGIRWFAPDSMTLSVMIYYLWAALNTLGR
jgi:hypothetical protein